MANNSIFGTLVNIVANLVGAGLLSLPATLMQAGLAPGLVMQLLMCALNTASMLCIAQSCELSGKFTFKEHGVFALGRPAGVAITAVMALYTLGSLISFVVLIGDNLPALVCESGCNNATQAFFGDRTVAIVLASACVLFPLSLLRNLSALRFTSTLSTVCILYIGLMIGVRCMADDPPRASRSEIAVGSTDPLRALATAPVTAVAYCLHYNSARYYYELRDRSLPRFAIATLTGFGLVCALYLLTAIGGYFLFGSATKGDVLLNFPSNDIPAVVARISIVLIVLGCYPLAFNAHRTNVILLLPQRWQDVLNSTPLPQKRPIDTTMSALLLPSEDHSLQASDVNDAQATPGLWKQLLQSAPHALLTALLVLISMVVGIAVPNVEVILAYKGALGGSWIIYIFPGTVWFVLLQMHRYAGRIAASAASVDEFEREKPTPTDAELRAVPVGVIWQLKDVFFAPRGILMVALVLWGLVVLFVGTITTAMGL